MDFRIEISGERAVCKQDGAEAFSAPLASFLAKLGESADRVGFPEAIPPGVRFIHQRGNAMVLTLEEQPQVRTVRWLIDDSPAPFGKGAVYRTVRLAFPFVIVIVAFRQGGLTGFQQCFYRTQPLQALADPLLLPNLYNVAKGYGQTCWLCLANLKQNLAPLTWNEKIREIRGHLWSGAFNRSSEVHEGMSYWGAMRSLDRRVASVASWEEASREDPFFPLQVNWKPAGKTVGGTIDEMLNAIAPPPPGPSVLQLVQLLNLAGGRPGRHASAAPKK